jgi:hypothetical protein
MMRRRPLVRETRAARLAAVIVVLVQGITIGCHSTTHVAASAACPAQPLDDARFGVRYLPCQLTTLPVLQVDPALWRYPDMMVSAEMAGRARIAFIVDTAGRYVPGSARGLSSTHVGCQRSAIYQLQQARFAPGRRARAAVPVELTYDFVYVIPGSISAREISAEETVPKVALAWMPSAESIPALEIRLIAEDTRLGPPPAPQLRDSLAHMAIRTRAWALGWENDSRVQGSKGKDLVLCVQGESSVLESAADRALATSMNRPHVRVMTMRECPPTRASMQPDFPGIQRPHYPDSATFVEPHRLQVTEVGVRRGGGPQVDLFDEHGTGGLVYRCVRMPGSSSIFVLRCYPTAVVAH